MNTTTPHNEQSVPRVTLPVDLRDYFAAKAMQGLLKVNRPSDIGVMRQEWADESYLLADAMLKARQS